MTDYGTDFACVDDLETTLVMSTGIRVVAEAIARRLQTPTGRLIGDANYGYNLADWCGADVGPRDIDEIQAACSAEAEKDERVRSAQTTATFASDVLTVSLVAVLITDEVFTLVLAVSAVTVEILQVT
jgi:hypothetical protein